VSAEARHAVAYVGRSVWLVDGQRGTWAESYRYLIQVCGEPHSRAVRAMAAAVRLDRSLQRI
jgi:hypothetical protein